MHRYRNKFTCDSFDFGCGIAVATALASKAIATNLFSIATIIISVATIVIAAENFKNSKNLRLF